MPDAPTFQEQLDELLPTLPQETRDALRAQELLSGQIARQLYEFMRVRWWLMWLLFGNGALAIVNAAMLWRQH